MSSSVYMGDIMILYIIFQIDNILSKKRSSYNISASIKLEVLSHSSLSAPRQAAGRGFMLGVANLTTRCGAADRPVSDV